MTDYTELIRQLKTYEDGYGLYDAAADAIEELQKTLKAVQENSGINFRMWEEAQAEIERLQAEVEKWTFNATLEQSKAIANFESYCKLKAQLPKRGEWIKDEEQSQKHVEAIYTCSACHNFDAWGVTELYPYCPNCGAKMEVQDGK